MLFKAKWLRLACLLVVVGWAASASAQVARYPLSGDAGLWIGGGLPVPVTGVPPIGYANRGMKATPNATVLATTGPDPQQLQIRPSKITIGATPRIKGQWGNNPNLFMVTTTLDMRWPAPSGVAKYTPAATGTITLKAGGRTGPPTYTFCPGNPATCTPLKTYKGVAGQLTYKALKNQFGGPGQTRIQGQAIIWARVASPPPCVHTIFAGPNANCIAVKGIAQPAPLGNIGAPFGYYTKTTPVQAAPNVYFVTANATGTIGLKVGVATTPFKNTANGFGGPWTTGQLTLVQKAATPAETFTITGSDNRSGGVGTVSLVAGGISNRAVSGPNANRGWVSLTVGRWRDTPSLSSWGIASLVLVLAGVGAAGMSLARRKR